MLPTCIVNHCILSLSQSAKPAICDAFPFSRFLMLDDDNMEMSVTSSGIQDVPQQLSPMTSAVLSNSTVDSAAMQALSMVADTPASK